MGGSTDWLSAIGILLSGLVLGVMFIYVYARRRQNTAAADEHDLELRELQARRDALIQQLRELDDEGVTEGEERHRLEVKTAEVLRALDGQKVAAKTKSAGAGAKGAAPAAAADGFFARNPSVKGFIWGVASIAGVGLLGFYVYSSAKDRNAGGSPTGGTNMAQQEAMPADHPGVQAANDPAIKQLEAEVSASPDDVEKRIALTRAYLDRDNLMGVFAQTKAILDKNPDEPRAQTYNAIVRMSMGQIDQAKSMLQAATRKDPSITDGWVALAFIATQQGNTAEADAAINSAVKAHPEQEKRLREVLAEMRSHPPAQPAAPPLQPGTDTANLPPGHPPVGGATAPLQASAGAGMMGGAPPAAAPAADAVHITLNIDPKANPKSGVVFVFARPEGQAGGPPVAVKKLMVSSFPTTVELSSSDSMMGDPLPSRIHIEARLASSGAADATNSTDPRAILDGVATKSSVKMTLR